MPRRLIEQLLYEVLRHPKVTGEKCNRACPGQRVAQRQRVMERAGFVDAALGGTHGPIRKSLEPQDPRKSGLCRYPLLKLEADDMCPMNGGAIATQHTLEVVPRFDLPSQEMQ